MSGNKKTINFTKYILGFWAVLFMLFLLFVLFVWGIKQGFFYGELPSTKSLENPENPLASEVYTSDGIVLGKFYSQNRTNVEYHAISSHVIDALVATEDVRFNDHAGIDAKGTSSIIYYLIQGKKRGASTISQQLAKNLFPRKGFSNLFEIIVTKIKEWIIAIQLERNYTKQEILTMYLNTVDFGSNSFGIHSASMTYFNKSPDSLNVQEAASLVGLLKGTTMYSPVSNPVRAVNRRNTVLHQMAKYNFISHELYDSLRQEPIQLNYRVASHTTGMANHFREYLRMQLARWASTNNYNIYTDGLKIYTTIDSRMQQYAEEAAQSHLNELQQVFFQHWKGREPWGVHTQLLDHSMKRSDRYRTLKAKGLSEKEIRKIFDEKVDMRIFSYQGDIDTNMSPMDSIKYYKHFLRTGMMAMESESGHIKAWVSGPSYRYFKYDHVNVNAKRQVGSTFKPFVFAVAIMSGYSPCFKVPNVPIVFEDYQNWSPTNVDGKYGGMKTLKQGLSNSINTITAFIMKQVGPEPVVTICNKFGITSHIDPYPAISLGTPDISVYEMTGAFNTFANKGVWTEPIFIMRIEDRNGNVLQDFLPKTVEVMDEVHNYIMVDMLKDVILHGTGMRLRGRYQLRNEIAGKTGTTQNHSDGWFIGFTPELTAGVWVGAEDRAVRFRSTSLGQGANMALPIWGLFMQKVLEDKTLPYDYDKKFPLPSGDINIELDCSKYIDRSESEPRDVHNPFN